MLLAEQPAYRFVDADRYLKMRIDQIVAAREAAGDPDSNEKAAVNDEIV